MADHLSYSTLLVLIRGRLEDEAAIDAFGHLAYCAECSARLAGVREVRADFETSWGEFVTRRSRLAAAAPSRAAVLLRVTLDGVRVVARIALEHLAPGFGTDFEARVLPVPSGAGADAPTERRPQAEFRLVFPELGTATVVADAERQTISVLLRAPTDKTLEDLLREQAPRVVLRSPDGLEVRELSFSLVEGADYLLAEARGLAGIDWIVAVESDRIGD